MNLLIIGSGGREHALGWKLKKSSKVNKIYFAPGNGGTLEIGENIEMDLSDHATVAEWAAKNSIDLVIIGPDEYLAAGLTDSLLEAGLKVFGPTKAAAEIEWSKSFAKTLMKQEGIPTAEFEVFSDIERARQFLRNQRFPLVIKADGLALGKGVVIAENLDEADKALLGIMRDRIFGKAGREVVIEEYLAGYEISIHAFCDGETALLFPPSQDRKRIYDGDKGPNTGGMGTIAPLAKVSEAHLKKIKETIVMPTLTALNRLGRSFRGVLYPGLMMTSDGPKVIEFNARFGDPETQSYMRLLDSDLLEALLACADGNLADIDIKWSNQSACCLILASEGYPGVIQTDIPISGIQEAKKMDAVLIFHSGTKISDNQLKTAGGRVLGITATGNNSEEARQKAYAAARTIEFKGMQYRKDIGARA